MCLVEGGGGVGGGGLFADKSSGRPDRQTYPQQQQKELNRHSLVPSCGRARSTGYPRARPVDHAQCMQTVMDHTPRGNNASEQSPVTSTSP